VATAVDHFLAEDARSHGDAADAAAVAAGLEAVLGLALRAALRVAQRDVAMTGRGVTGADNGVGLGRRVRAPQMLAE
jgi:hypothetical protein